MSGGPSPSLTPLGLPRPVRVRLDGFGEPAAVERSRGHGALGQDRWRRVLQVEEVWRVAEEWWREEAVARTYVRVVLEDGRPLTLFHDDTLPRSDGWFEQAYRAGEQP